MNRVMLVIAAGGLTSSAVVHVLTFVPGVPIAMRHVWFLHVVVFVPFITMIGRAIQLGRSRGMDQRTFQRELVGLVPRRVRLVAIVGFVYMLVNFALSIVRIGGSPLAKDGHYYTANHGTITREISEAEYRRLESVEVRGFSGHWMVFYGIPLIFFAWAEPRAMASSPGRAAR
jgi:hypothetical protein